MALQNLCRINFESNFDSFDREKDVTDGGNLENPTQLALPPTGVVIHSFLLQKEIHSCFPYMTYLTTNQFYPTNFDVVIYQIIKLIQVYKPNQRHPLSG